ncbi:unnamed protein product [Sphacelaria rigidula]
MMRKQSSRGPSSPTTSVATASIGYDDATDKRKVGAKKTSALRVNSSRHRRENSAKDYGAGSATVTFAVDKDVQDGDVRGDEDDGFDEGIDATLMLSSSLGVKKSELTEREGELFGRLQAETVEMRQRACAAEKAEQEARVETDRLAAATNSALESALAEGKRLKAEAEAREVL